MKDGHGVYYNPHEQALIFTVSSWNIHCTSTDSLMMAGHLNEGDERATGQ